MFNLAHFAQFIKDLKKLKINATFQPTIPINVPINTLIPLIRAFENRIMIYYN
jgi:hypothetical protein